MSTTYRVTRNIEATLIEYIEAQLTAGSWTNIEVEKSFARVYDIEVGGSSSKAVICVMTQDAEYDRLEIGTTSLIPTRTVLIDIFAASDGQKLDLQDFLIGVFKSGCVYYEFLITNGAVDTRTANGRLRVLTLTTTPINFDSDKNELDPHDRFRCRITLQISRGVAE